MIINALIKIKFTYYIDIQLFISNLSGVLIY